MTAGPTIEYIDPVRVITNLSSGKTGVLLASELISAGAKVTMKHFEEAVKKVREQKDLKIGQKVVASYYR